MHQNTTMVMTRIIQLMMQMLRLLLMVIFYVSGLVAEGEKAQKQTGGLVVTKDLMGNIQHTHYVP